MKTILTLFLSFVALTTLQAQTREETRRVILGEPKNRDVYDERRDDEAVYGRQNDRYSSNNRHQQYIDQVNREYRNKIESIRDNRYLDRSEKERMIRQLERDRQQRISQIKRTNSDRYDNHRSGKKDNGKHKGWYKKDKRKDKKHRQ